MRHGGQGHIRQRPRQRNQPEGPGHFRGNELIRLWQSLPLLEVLHKCEVLIFIPSFPQRNKDRVEEAAGEKHNPNDQEQNQGATRHVHVILLYALRCCGTRSSQPHAVQHLNRAVFGGKQKLGVMTSQMEERIDPCIKVGTAAKTVASSSRSRAIFSGVMDERKPRGSCVATVENSRGLNTISARWIAIT